MFDRSVFRTWGRVVAGASLLAGLFMVLMLLVEQVAGDGARLTRAVVGIGAAAFLGYVGTAWIVRSGEE